MSQDRMNSAESNKKRTVTQPNVKSTIERATRSLEKVHVAHGVNEDYFDLQGQTIGKVRKSLREAFNIPENAISLINGKEVSDDFVLEAGTNLEFLHEAGDKGEILALGLLKKHGFDIPKRGN
jgi:hypothetical protein